MTQPAAPAPTDERTFIGFLSQLEDGVLQTELSDTLRDLVAAMKDHARTVGGKPTGKLGLVLAFKLDGGLFDITAAVKVDTPKRVRSRSLLYATADNRLTANNPKQLEMGLQVRDASIAGSSSNLRSVR